MRSVKIFCLMAFISDLIGLDQDKRCPVLKTKNGFHFFLAYVCDIIRLLEIYIEYSFYTVTSFNTVIL